MQIFNAPLYTGCKDDGRNYNKVGTNHPRRIRFWLPFTVNTVSIVY